MADRARWLLLTHPGHVVLATAYAIAALVSVLVYTVTHSPAYGLGQLVVLSTGLGWARWCLTRPARG